MSDSSEMSLTPAQETYAVGWLVMVWYLEVAWIMMFISWVWTTVEAWDIEWVHGLVAMLSGWIYVSYLYGLVICYINFKRSAAPAIFGTVSLLVGLGAVIGWIVMWCVAPELMPSGSPLAALRLTNLIEIFER